VTTGLPASMDPGFAAGLGSAAPAIAVVAVVAMVVLLWRGARVRSRPIGGRAVWRGGRTGKELPLARQQAEARVGEPLAAFCPLELRAQDRPRQRWQGSQHMWMGLGEQTVWFLHHSTLGRIGGVWDSLPRHGLHVLATERRHAHEVELSWPHLPRLMIARLGGQMDERRRLLGLLAADELDLRAEAERPPR
jgi:hypothetical protein